MTPYVITVEFRLRPNALAAFLPLIEDNARRSLREEPGCRQFDVLVSHETHDRVFLYEIYDDENAFIAHCQSAHFKEFDNASRDLCEAKTVQRYTLTLDTKAETATTGRNDQPGERHAQAMESNRK